MMTRQAKGNDGKNVPFSPYQLKLLFFLSAATFFDGYDFMGIIQLLPNIRADFGISKEQGGMLISFINLGTVTAYFMLRATDKLGRKKILRVTILGYTLATFASGFAPEIISFAICQFVARMFVIAECSIAMVYGAEEFPAERRGLVMGIIQGSLSLGMIFCAAIVPVLIKTGPGWRSIYFVGILPLLLLAFFRRTLQETKRFSAESGIEPNRQSFLHIWKTPYRRRLLIMGLVWCGTYFCTQSAVTFWKEFALTERSFTDAQVGIGISLASLLSLPLVFYTGKFLDRAGRRRGALFIFGLEIAAVICSYSLHGFWPLTIALIGGIFGASAAMIVLNTYTTELFPTLLRGNAYAWANSIIGRTGFVLSPLIVGALAEQYGWGFSVQLTIAGPIIALVLILLFLPETKTKELEITSNVNEKGREKLFVGLTGL